MTGRKSLRVRTPNEASLAQKIGLKWGSKNTRIKIISHIVESIFMDIGLRVGGSVTELHSKNGSKAYLISLHMQGLCPLPPEDLLALRIYIRKKIEQVHRLPSKAITILLRMNTEAKTLNVPETLLTLHGMRERVENYKTMVRRATHSTSASAPMAKRKHQQLDSARGQVRFQDQDARETFLDLLQPTEMLHEPLGFSDTVILDEHFEVGEVAYEAFQQALT